MASKLKTAKIFLNLSFHLHQSLSVNITTDEYFWQQLQCHNFFFFNQKINEAEEQEMKKEI